jgi:hypothetical protein
MECKESGRTRSVAGLLPEGRWVGVAMVAT